MEVAGQWRREWAGAAEYGKVTEGGVTRQVARAMEVMNASAPGARMRVVRAAYHSSSGPGAPASSYTMHSSRRVISSGTRLLSPSLTSRPFGDTPSLPSLPSLPLEISSTPLDILPDTPETENYKVTEPDDSEISAPSKWKGSADKNSIRMPSEESSSTDNASIIDLDPRTNHKSVFRKYSYDSENSDISSIKVGSRASPLLDAPITLSTLKYKSLLNGSNDWNNRRKSYSFEETAPLNETISHCNDTLAIESSTDSGICKSSEIVNDNVEYERKDRKYDTQEDTFKDWLHKNRQTSFNKNNSFKSYREHNVLVEEPSESNITLQSTGKVSITVPITLDDDYQHKKGHTSEETDRRVKKVEFCKTELHFAAESGRVNIIATDEKPPPTNDFRRKKSAFMTITNKPERPITLFGEKKTHAGDAITEDLFNHNTSEVGEFDENTAATKSILKNKIPKPKPYLLGENIAFGLNDDRANTNKPSIQNKTGAVSTAVSLINRQLQSERRYSDDTTSSLSSEIDTSAPKRIVSRPTNTGLTNSVCSKSEYVKSNQYSSASEVNHTFNSAQNKFKALQMSPIPTRSKTRQLRQSDLTYFGIQNDKRNTPDDKPKFIRDRIKMHNDAIDNIFQSVRLIQQVSNSVCNSEAESEEAVEYQNVPFKTNFAPVPTPRSRTKYPDKSDHETVTVLKPIIEQDSRIVKQNSQLTRRSRSRKYEELVTPTIRSISEPPKINKPPMEKLHRRHNYIQQNPSPRINKYEKEDEVNNRTCSPGTAKLYLSEEDEEDLAPTYVNVNREVIADNKAHITNEIHRQPNITRKFNNKNEIKSSDCKENNGSQCNSYDRVHKAKIHKGSINSKTNSTRKKKIVQKADIQDKPCADQHSKDNLKNARKSASPDKKENKHKDEKTMSIKKQSGSVRRAEKNISEQNIENVNNAHQMKGLKELESTNELHKSQHVRTTSRHSPAKKDTVEHQKRSSINSADHQRNSLQIKTSERNGESRYSKERPKSKRDEYVINYDDKNGTVTSVCKVSDPGSAKKKKTSLQKIKDSPQEYKAKHKTSEKINLLPRSKKESKQTRESRAQTVKD